MTCPRCYERTKVIDSQAEEGCVRRRHSCPACGYRFFTIEIDEDLYERMVTVKNEQTLYRDECRHRPVRKENK